MGEASVIQLMTPTLSVFQPGPLCPSNVVAPSLCRVLAKEHSSHFILSPMKNQSIPAQDGALQTGLLPSLFISAHLTGTSHLLWVYTQSGVAAKEAAGKA